MPVPGMNREQMMQQKRLAKPYVSQTDPRFEKAWMDHAGESDQDGDAHTRKSGYNSRGMNDRIGEAYTDGQLDPKGRLRETFERMEKQFGADTAAQILDEVMRVAASEDISYQGPMDPPDNINQDGMYGASSYPPPDFGSQQPHTTLPPTDGNLRALEEFNGYPVSAQPGPGPVRNQTAPMPGQKRLRRR